MAVRAGVQTRVCVCASRVAILTGPENPVAAGTYYTARTCYPA